MESQYKHPQVQAIHKIIHQAEVEAGKNLEKAIDLLNKAKKILPHINEGSNSEDKMTMANNTIDNASAQLTFKSKLANLYYNIHQYENALAQYKKMLEVISTNPKIYKAEGDCLRHLKRFSESIQAYEQGLKICSVVKSFGEFKATILNSEGLTYTAEQNYPQAITKFQDALKISPNNPLYYCNLAGALSKQGQRQKAIYNYETAQKMLKEPLEQQGLTKDNVKYIQKSLNKFLQNLKKLHSINTKDETFNARVNNYGGSMMSVVDNTLVNPKEAAQGNTTEADAKLMMDSSKILQFIQKQQNMVLYEYYSGMKSTMEVSYVSSQMIIGGKFNVNTGNLATTVASNIAAFLPICGAQLSGAITSIGNFINGADITKQANNIAKLHIGQIEFNGLSQDATLRFIMKNKETLLKINPVENILPAWAQSFEVGAKWLKEKKEQFENDLFGNRYDTDMQKYGFKNGNDLVAKYIAVGKIYQGQPSIRIPNEQKIKRLVDACDEILKEDQHIHKEKAKHPKGEKKESKCEIY